MNVNGTRDNTEGPQDVLLFSLTREGRAMRLDSRVRVVGLVQKSQYPRSD